MQESRGTTSTSNDDHPVLSAVTPEDARYFQDYEAIKDKVPSYPGLKGHTLADEPPNLDVRIRMIFDEDLKTMIFPKVKVMIFRVSSDTPFEVAAKALAVKNGHRDLWKHYSFSIMMKDKSEERLDKHDIPFVINDLRKCFGTFKKDDHEIVFFYKINGIANAVQ